MNDQEINQAKVMYATKPAAPTMWKRFLLVHRELEPIKKDAVNPHFNNGFASLENVITSVNGVLLKHGFYVSQPVVEGFVETHIIDSEHGVDVIPRSRYPVIAKDPTDPQKFAGGVTYARRISLLGILAIPTVDDDGNTAASNGNGKTTGWKEPLGKTMQDDPELQKKIPEALLKHHPGWVGMTWEKAAQHVGFSVWIKKLIEYESAKPTHTYKEKNLATYRAALALSE